MGVAIVTGSTGLVGAEAVRQLGREGLDVLGVDNDMRAVFFGPQASTTWCREELESTVPGYTHLDVDIRDEEGLTRVFRRIGSEIEIVVHAAAQPSHDWAAREPHTDFTVNANGTLVLLELVREFCPDAPFIFTSTNKVYGDAPNALPLEETDTRWEIAQDHRFHARGIDESMRVDRSLHSLFGVSKLAADLLVQEYGRYFGLKTVCFRGGCITGSGHSGAELHGFLAYLFQCGIRGEPYTVYGYNGKQVRDNIHCHDLVQAFLAFFDNPRSGAVYNMGGGRHSNCSVLEAIARIEDLTGTSLQWTYDDTPRIGDHIWYVSDVSSFQRDYPDWRYSYDLERIAAETYDGLVHRIRRAKGA